MNKTNYNKKLFDDYYKLELDNISLTNEIKYLKYEYKLLESKNKTLQSKIDDMNDIIEHEKNKEKEKYQKIIDEKDKEIARLKSLLNNDGTNCSIPTSKTPINKNKVIPNSRNKSDKTKGGQLGHKKHKLEKFKDEEITEEEEIVLHECPSCSGKLIDTLETIDKDVFDYKLVISKKRVKFKVYKCPCCNKKVHSKIPNELKEDNQYGPNVKTLTLELLNEGVVSINRVRRIIKGFTNNEIDLSEGYIAKLQKISASKLKEFNNELKLRILKQKLVYWDDTVIFVNKKRSCLRFYGDEKIAYYTAHERKNKDGLDEDNILNSLDNQTIVMHDHNKVNYNKDYSFINIECIAHLQRDIQKVIDNLDRNWAKELKNLISNSINDRIVLIKQKKKNDEKFSKEFFEKFTDIMLSAIKENGEAKDEYYRSEEKTLILRILDYKENYFAWVNDFELPTTNNLSERALRGSKTKQKISGQFQNIERANDYALIKSYIETSYRNGTNPYEALFRLSLGKPLTVTEILGEENNE